MRTHLPRLQGDGAGVHVGDGTTTSLADYHRADPHEVEGLLRRLAGLPIE